MEEIPQPEGDSWAKAKSPTGPKRLPGFTFLAWLAVIAAAACWQLLHSAADQALAAGMPRFGAALQTMAGAVAVGLAVAAAAVALRKGC